MMENYSKYVHAATKKARYEILPDDVHSMSGTSQYTATRGVSYCNDE